MSIGQCDPVLDPFAVIAEPHRRDILNRLLDGEASVGELVGFSGLSQPAVSKHLRILRDAGLVRARTDRQRRLYRLDLEPLREVDEWLTPYRHRWSGALGRLGEHLAATRSATSFTDGS
jgi:DNA-binding transcriptional ArsR family regulator